MDYEDKIWLVVVIVATISIITLVISGVFLAHKDVQIKQFQVENNIALTCPHCNCALKIIEAK